MFQEEIYSCMVDKRGKCISEYTWTITSQGFDSERANEIKGCIYYIIYLHVFTGYEDDL